MAFAGDLLRDAHHLADRGGKNPRQSSLRRAISTAYYALFHLLISEFVLNWKPKDQRARLGRMFEHRKMSHATYPFKAGPQGAVERQLQAIIEAFGQLQDHRNSAAYDVGRVWARIDVKNTLSIADEAFKSWKNIRKEKIAQEHFLTMFGARRT